MDSCECGHDLDDHGHDPAYPGSTACADEDCQCIAFERAEPCCPDCDRDPCACGERA